eukprot:GHVO01068123.1.p1 GENE.GHVO01068123.1~~GHVO01068123.1.p1  ORF type:complete len:226 (+),score=29.63 GHVO01068123.1:528-1205(+)
MSQESAQDEPTSPKPVAQVRVPDAEKVVGPSAEELESFNELIQFDHVYFKPSAPQQASSPGNVKKNVSILKRSVVKKPHCQVKEKTPVLPETPLNIPEADLASLSQTLDEIIDFDSLVAVDCKPAVSSFSSVDGGRKRKAETAMSDIPFVKKQSVLSLSDSAGLFPGSEHFGLEASLSPGLPSESGYCSDSSGHVASSPKSDVSGDLGLDNSWEESFSELFPSLL